MIKEFSWFMASLSGRNGHTSEIPKLNFKFDSQKKAAVAGLHSKRLGQMGGRSFRKFGLEKSIGFMRRLLSSYLTKQRFYTIK